jgi:hypothetical protein
MIVADACSLEFFGQRLDYFYKASVGPMLLIGHGPEILVSLGLVLLVGRSLVLLAKKGLITVFWHAPDDRSIFGFDNDKPDVQPMLTKSGLEDPTWKVIVERLLVRNH